MRYRGLDLKLLRTERRCPGRATAEAKIMYNLERELGTLKRLIDQTVSRRLQDKGDLCRILSRIPLPIPARYL